MDDNPVQTARGFTVGHGDDPKRFELTKNNANLGMWVGFLHVVFFISLYFLATSSASILHEAVNRFVKDPLELETAARSYLGLFSISSFKEYWLRYSLASLIVSYPIFTFLFILIKRLEMKRPEAGNFRIRHLLIYITLTVTFIFFNYAFIKVLYAYLDGSLTMRSILHMVVTVSISFVIFVYYLFAIKEDRK